MKKKYIALTVCLSLLVLIASGGLLLFRNGNRFHRGHALISDSGSFIFIDDTGAPIVMGDADEKKFSDITDGDEVLVLYGMVMTTYPAQASTPICLKLADGSIENVNEGTVRQLKELGWLRGERPFENLEGDDIADITVAEFSSSDEPLKSRTLTAEEKMQMIKLLKNMELAHDGGEAVRGGCIGITLTHSGGETQKLSLYDGNNTVTLGQKNYVGSHNIFEITDFAREMLK